MKVFASIQIAVLIIIAIGIIAAVGTVIEAKYDMYVAQKLVYHSWWMRTALLVLITTLIAVMVDRWPWKRRHTGFVLAHIGIIILLAGAVMTQELGIDGQMMVGIGEESQFVSLPAENEFVVWSTFDGDNFTPLYRQKVDFFLNRPTVENPYQVHLGEKQLKVIDYIHYALAQEKIVKTEELGDGPALRIQMQNDQMQGQNVNFAQWIQRANRKNVEIVRLGPANIVLSDGSYQSTSGNEIVFVPRADGQKIDYWVYLDRLRQQKPHAWIKKGTVQAGESFEPGWMGFKLRILNYYPHAKLSIDYERMDGSTDLTMPAVLVDFNGEKHWIGLNSMARFFTESGYFGVVYGNQRVKLNFPIKLKEFNIGRYQGTMRASSYSSKVILPDGKEVTVSMNNPLKFEDYTFYQASFVEDETGRPTASVFSVNYDPGRPVKYVGCLTIVLGIIMLFYFKRQMNQRKPKNAVKISRDKKQPQVTIANTVDDGKEAGI